MDRQPISESVVGQRPNHLRPDPLCQPLVAPAGDGVARREECRRPGSGGRSPGPGRCGRGGAGQDGTDPSPGPGRTCSETSLKRLESVSTDVVPGGKIQEAQAEHVQAQRPVAQRSAGARESRPCRSNVEQLRALPEEKLARTSSIARPSRVRRRAFQPGRDHRQSPSPEGPDGRHHRGSAGRGGGSGGRLAGLVPIGGHQPDVVDAERLRWKTRANSPWDSRFASGPMEAGTK